MCVAALGWPFVGTEALEAGTVTDHRLRSSYMAIHRNVYVPRNAELTAADKAVAAWLFSRRRAVVAGMSAAALHGTRWIDPQLPAELNRPGRDKVDGIVLHSDALAEDETCIINGVPATTPARTAFDIGRRRGLENSVIRLDALMQATRLKTPDIDLLVERHAGARGIIQLRNAISLADAGSESPQGHARDCSWSVRGCHLQRRRSRSTTPADTSSHAWTWVGCSTRWASSTTVPSTGPIPVNGVVTSIGWRSSTRSSG